MSDGEENEGHANDLIPAPVSKLRRSYTQKKEALEKLATNFFDGIDQQSCI